MGLSAQPPDEPGLANSLGGVASRLSKALDEPGEKTVWTIQKAMDEGTAEPFIARLMVEILDLRDHVIRTQISPERELEQSRKAFDDLYKPVLESMCIMRKAVRYIQELVTGHRSKVEAGDIIGRQRNAVQIHESINADLKDQLSRFVNSAVRAIKSLQKVTSHLGLNISGFFAKEHNFERHMKDLEEAGHGQLGQYLRKARKGWSERLVARRNVLEHDGWTLDDVKYRIAPDGELNMIEPRIDSQKVSEWVTTQNAHVLAFVEDVLVYCFQAALPADVAIVEIPATERNPANPSRFRLTLPAVEGVAPWSPQYDPLGFR